MFAPTPRPVAQPSPIKPPERCPYCQNPGIRPKGTRTKKLEKIPQYYCPTCVRTFCNGSRAIRNKTYPVQAILEALTLYNRGYSLAATAKQLSLKFGFRADPSTISRWLKDYRTFTTYRRLRDHGSKQFHPTRIITTVKLHHAQVYEYAYHHGKLSALSAGTLDPQFNDRRTIVSTIDFLKGVPHDCPHELFVRDQGARSSALDPTFVDIHHVMVTERTNTATETAAAVLPSVGTNHMRHSVLQRFMLANDSATIAVEVPIWLDEAAITKLETRHSIKLLPKVPVNPDNPTGPYKPRMITGHIDFLQVRRGCIHVLDYKPDARTNKPISQLVAYALALTHLIPGLTLFEIRCAWFNEKCYNEFFPRLALRKRRAPGSPPLLINPKRPHRS